jgi:hypothetical protein
MHKVLTYLEYRAMSGVFQNIDPHPPSTHRVCPPPHQRRGGTHSPGGEGVGGQIWKTPDIGLASYSIIPLRSNAFNLEYRYLRYTALLPVVSSGSLDEPCSAKPAQWSIQPARQAT